ncbi:MAG TPA: hypothetical protein VFM17_08005 [Candidatus Eisenbacteria bacterium]|nr:hypothetical protein [Candidatus Eisenbacteria bacterium]
MVRIRTLFLFALALVLALGVSACQKSAETEVAATEENPATAEETPAVEPAPVVTEPAPAPAAPATPAKTTTTTKPKTTTATPAAAKSTTVSIPAGTAFDVTLTTPVDTRTSNVGDKVEGTLVAPLTAEGVTIAEQGAVIRGEITELTRASRAKSEEDRASVKFQFTSLETVEGEKTITATVTNAEGKMIAKGTGTRDKLTILGSTVAGAVIGKVAGKDTKSTILGAVGGAVLGTGVVMASKGHELEVPAGSKVSLRADSPITIVSK